MSLLREFQLEREASTGIVTPNTDSMGTGLLNKQAPSLISEFMQETQGPMLTHEGLAPEVPLTAAQKIDKYGQMFTAPQQAVSDFITGAAAMAPAGLAAGGSFLLPEPEGAGPDYKIDRARQVVEAISGAARSDNPYAHKLMAPVEKAIESTIGKAAGLAGDVTVDRMTEAGASPEVVAGLASGTHAVTELAAFALLGRGIGSLKAKPKSLVPAGQRTVGMSKFDQIKAQHPNMTLGQLLREYPEYREFYFEEQGLGKGEQAAKTATPEPTATPTPEPTPTPSTSTPSGKVSFKQNVLNKVVDLGSLDAVEAFYVKDKRGSSLAKSMARKIYQDGMAPADVLAGYESGTKASTSKAPKPVEDTKETGGDPVESTEEVTEITEGNIKEVNDPDAFQDAADAVNEFDAKYNKELADEIRSGTVDIETLREIKEDIEDGILPPDFLTNIVNNSQPEVDNSIEGKNAETKLKNQGKKYVLVDTQTPGQPKTEVKGQRPEDTTEPGPSQILAVEDANGRLEVVKRGDKASDLVQPDSNTDALLEELEAELGTVDAPRLKSASDIRGAMPTVEGPDVKPVTINTTHKSSNLESLENGFEDRIDKGYGVSLARTPEEQLSSPTVAEPKGTSGVVNVTVTGKGLDYKNPEHREFIDSIWEKQNAEIEAGKREAFNIPKVLRDMGYDYVDNWNSIGEAPELHLINNRAATIVKPTSDGRTKIRVEGKGDFYVEVNAKGDSYNVWTSEGTKLRGQRREDVAREFGYLVKSGKSSKVSYIEEAPESSTSQVWKNVTTELKKSNKEITSIIEETFKLPEARGATPPTAPEKMVLEALAPKEVQVYETQELAEADYLISPRTFSSEAKALGFAKAKGENWEALKIGDKYRVGQDWTFADTGPAVMDPVAKLLTENIDESLDLPDSPAKTETITVKEFAKVGDAWIGNVDGTRSVGIIKEGKNYEAYLGTPAEIQSGTAELVDSFSSLAKARAAFKSIAESKKVTTRPKKSVEEVMQYLRDQVEEHKTLKEQDSDELSRLIAEQEMDILDGDTVSLEEMAHREALAEFDDEGYYEGRELGDVTRDIMTVLGDERGALFPKNSEVTAAKARLKDDVHQLGKIAQRIKERMKDKVNDWPVFTNILNRLRALLKRLTTDQRGAVDLGPLVNSVHEFAGLFKKAYNGIKKSAIASKDWLLSERRSSPYGNYSSKDQAIIVGGAMDTAGKMVKAIKTDAHAATVAMVADMKARRRIVDEHDGKSDDIPVRQLPQIDAKSRPALKPGVEKMAPHILGKLQSPSHIFGRIFNTKDNPIVDVMESAMAFANNWRNSEKWAKTLLKGIPDVSTKLQNELDAMYEPARALVRKKNRMDDKIRVLTSKLAAETDPAKKETIVNIIKALRKQQKARMAKLKKDLTQVYDNNIGRLATEHADVRILLQAAEELPEGITLSEREMVVATKMREFFDKTRDELEATGIPVIKDRTYMHRMLPSLFNDEGARGFMSDQKIPVLLKFMHQDADGRLWYPSAHMVLRHYIPMVERKLAYQPFLNRWRDVIDELPEDISGYMDKWVKANLLNRPRGDFEKMLDGVVAFEYMRLIGGSLSVAFKHATKVADSLVRFDPVTNTKAINSTGKAVVQAAMKSLGVKGDYAELALMKAFVNQKAMVRLMDESPGTGVIIQKTKFALAFPTIAVETLDNGVTIFSTMLANASEGKLSIADAERIIWETVLTANFRGGADQPLFYKTSGGRVLGMFQMTPYKLMEYRMELIQKALRGEVDAFGTKYSTMLLRYLMLMGAAESIARLFGNSLIDQILHLPYVSHFVKSTDKAPYYKPAEPSVAASPILQWLVGMKDKGIYTGSLDHLKYWGQISKFYKMKENKYPTSYYNGPWSHTFGIQKVGAGKGAKSAGSRSRSRTRSR